MTAHLLNVCTVSLIFSQAGTEIDLNANNNQKYLYTAFKMSDNNHFTGIQPTNTGNIGLIGQI